ncbi:unnamed protein product [Echinostoma caproni]|uniref:Rab3 GTPase-activating protein catalytic subunit n=1 Tax=Echinostoma caproni TaxID=27848 RepID=A0A183AKW8_9TREM|nr:unnamed protein product [Echinostoma caproni]
MWHLAITFRRVHGDLEQLGTTGSTGLVPVERLPQMAVSCSCNEDNREENTLLHSDVSSDYLSNSSPLRIDSFAAALHLLSKDIAVNLKAESVFVFFHENDDECWLCPEQLQNIFNEAQKHSIDNENNSLKNFFCSLIDLGDTLIEPDENGCPDSKSSLNVERKFDEQLSTESNHILVCVLNSKIQERSATHSTDLTFGLYGYLFSFPPPPAPSSRCHHILALGSAPGRSAQTVNEIRTTLITCLKVHCDRIQTAYRQNQLEFRADFCPMLFSQLNSFMSEPESGDSYTCLLEKLTNNIPYDRWWIRLPECLEAIMLLDAYLNVVG